MAESKHFIGATLSSPTRKNPNDWIPFVDWWEVFPGNRGPSRTNEYGLFDAPVGVRLEIEKAGKSDPIIVADRPWEARSALQPQHAWQRDGEYHLLYRSGNRMCYARSVDGAVWAKPDLGQVEYESSKRNNLIADLSPNPGFFEDPTAPPETRFRAMIQEGGWHDADTGEMIGDEEGKRRLRRQDLEGERYSGPRTVLRHWVAGFASADGIRWHRMADRIADFPADGGVAPGYDPDTGLYFSYLRPSGVGRRAIALTSTTDFLEWPEPTLVLYPDPQDAADVSFYGAGYFRYPGLYPLHCLLLQIYHQNTDHLDNQLAVSRDGVHWFRPERRPIVGVGDLGEGDDGITRCWVSGLLTLPDGTWAHPYEAISSLHNAQEGMWPPIAPAPYPPQIRLACWRPHRLCGLTADLEGRFTIQTIAPEGGKLQINYRARVGGQLRFELVQGIPSRLNPDAPGVPGFTFDDCDPVTGDSECHTVTWKGKNDVREAGANLGIRVRMFESKLFAFRI